MTLAAAYSGWSPTVRTPRQTVSVVLRGEAGDVDEQALKEFCDRIDGGVQRKANVDGWVELTFTQDAKDLWLTLLATMRASWATGYEPIEISARLVGDEEP